MQWTCITQREHGLYIMNLIPFIIRLKELVVFFWKYFLK